MPSPEEKRQMDSGLNFLEMYHSLLSAIDDAGGAIGWCTPEYIEEASVLELFNLIASNKIRFYHEKSWHMKRRPKKSKAIKQFTPEIQNAPKGKEDEDEDDFGDL